MDNVVNGSMEAHTPTAVKAMSDKMVHFRATMLASVGPAKGNPKPEANRHADSVIIHSEMSRLPVYKIMYIYTHMHTQVQGRIWGGGGEEVVWSEWRWPVM